MTLGIDPEDRIPAVSTKPASKWPRHFGVLVRAGVVVIVLGAAGASSWHYVKEHFLTPSAPSGPVPVIGPGNEPIKEPPKQPGGMMVPDQDKIILNGAAAQPKVEQILPPPPAPLPSPVPPPAAAQATPTPSPAGSPAAPASSPSTPTPPASASASPNTTSASPPAAAATPSRTIEAPAPQAMTVAPPAPPTPAARPASATTANPPAKPAVTATVSAEAVPPELAGHGWFVQLGAVRSTAAAQTEWTRLKHANADLLAPLSANAVRIDRGGAVLYRIEAGPLADAGAASHLCRSLQQRHVACIVLRP